jgi:hypothetical protein
LPDPAFISGARRDVTPQPFCQRRHFGSYRSLGLGVSGPLPPGVVLSAEPAAMARSFTPLDRANTLHGCRHLHVVSAVPRAVRTAPGRLFYGRF